MAGREGPPEPVEYQGRLLDLIINGEIEAALRLSSHLHAHYCSIPRDVQLEQCCWQDSFYVQGIKHALEFVVTARDAGRLKPDARPDSSLATQLAAREQGVAFCAFCYRTELEPMLDETATRQLGAVVGEVAS